MKLALSTFTLLYISVTSFGQNQMTQAQLTLGRLTTIHSMGLYSAIDEMKPEGKVVGSPYLDDEWQNANLLLFTNNERIDNYPVRYNIYNNVFEIKVGQEVKGLEGSKVKEYVRTMGGTNITDRHFVNVSELKSGEVTLVGFVEVLSDGNFMLLKKTDIVIKKPDYSEQFSVGSRDTQITKKELYYYSHNKGIYEMPKNAKKLAAIFGSKSTVVAEYMDNNKIRGRDEHDLHNVFDFFNRLN